MKKILYVCIIMICLAGVGLAGKVEPKDRDGTEDLVSATVQYVDGTGIVMSKTYEYKTYFKVFRMVYGSDGSVREIGPIYYDKEDWDETF